MISNIQDVLDEASKWMNYVGIEGIGQCEKDGKECIVVFVSSLNPNLPNKFQKPLKVFLSLFKNVVRLISSDSSNVKMIRT